MPPRLRSHSRAGTKGPGSADPSPTSPGAAAEMAPGGDPGTPAPSPATSFPLGIGPAPADGVGPLKPHAVAPFRRTLLLAGDASPTAPSAWPAPAPGGASPGSGSQPGWRRSGRLRAGAAASPKSGDLGSNGGRGVRVSGGSGSGGQGTFISLRSGSRIAKRPIEPDFEVSGGMGTGSHEAVGPGDQVHDEMLHQDEEVPTKRCKSILVGGVEMEYVADSESDDDEDCIVLSSTQMQLSSAPDAIDLNAVPLSSDASTDDGRNNGPVNTAKEQPGDLNYMEKDPSSVDSLHVHSSLDMFVDGVIKPSNSPVGFPETNEFYADKYFNKDTRRYKPRRGGKAQGKLFLGNNDSIVDASVGIHGAGSSRDLRPDDKGKGKIVVEENSLPLNSSDDEMVLEPAVSEEIQSVSRSNPVQEYGETIRRRNARQNAIFLAPKFAFFKADEDAHSDDDDPEEEEPAADQQDWPGPLSTAMRIIDERDAKLRARELNPPKLDKSADKAILWTPSRDKKAPNPLLPAPSLTSLCLQTLLNHAEGIESLAGIPEELKNKLLASLSYSRKMNKHLLEQLLCDSPITVQLSECSWLGEDDFETIFGRCKAETLRLLQLDLSGRCMPDYILPATLAKAPNCMPLLTKISLVGNYRLSDNGLDAIISAAPSLSSLNLCECSLLTSTGIESLANKLHLILRELYIDDCLNVEAMMILPALQKVEHLEVLSMSGIQSVCDEFVNKLIPVHGSNMRELAFAGCLQLTSSSIKTIGRNCPQLSSLDLRNLNKLHNSVMRHLRNGCRFINKLKLQRNTFSDEAVSRFLEESGGCLTELNLNNVEKVGNLTACAIAHKCSARLEVLDLSFCRELSNEALGLIVDSCSSMRILKLFGCTQITDVFLNGHSNSLVKILGIEGNILDHMDSH